MPKNLATLRAQFTKIKPWAAIAMLFAVILVAFYGFQSYRYWEARTQTETANAQIKTISLKLRDQVPNIETLEADLQLHQDLFETYRSAFTYTDMGEIMTIVSDTAADAKVHLAALSVGESIPVTRNGIKYQTNSLSITMKGNTDDIFGYLFQLHQAIPVVQMSGVTIADPHIEKSTAQVILTFYISPETVSESEEEGTR